MPRSTIRNALETLFKETFEGPNHPTEKWVVTNGIETGILDTLRSIPVELAREVPDGMDQSIVEHVLQLRSALENSLARLRGDTSAREYRAQWTPEDFDECAWQRLQRSLREAQLRLRMDIHDRDDFEHFDKTCGCIAVLAQASYHLGCLRQLVAVVKSSGHFEPNDGSACT